MGVFCVKCNQEIKYQKVLIKCTTCHNCFHKGCIGDYKKKLSAKNCCREISVTEESLNNSHINTRTLRSSTFQNTTNFHKSNSLPDINSSIYSSVDTMSINNLQNQSESSELTELPSDWRNLTPEEKQDKLILKFLNSDNFIQSKLDKLETIGRQNSDTLKIHDSRIAVVENSVKVQKDESSNVKSAVAYSRPTSEMTVDHVPRALLRTLKLKYSTKTDSELYETIVRMILDYIEAHIVKGDILELSEFVRKNPTNGMTFSMKVRFKSSCIRDFILEKKRSKGVVKYKDVFEGLEADDVVYMNEIVSKYTFDLLIRAKKKRSELSWDGKVWLRDGIVFAKSNIDNNIFPIITKADLSHIS